MHVPTSDATILDVGSLDGTKDESHTSAALKMLDAIKTVAEEEAAKVCAAKEEASAARYCKKVADQRLSVVTQERHQEAEAARVIIGKLCHACPPFQNFVLFSMPPHGNFQ